MAEMQYLGKQTLGSALPTGLAAALSAQTTLQAQLPALTAQLSARLELTPPALMTDLIDNLRALIEALIALAGSGVAVVPPAINLDASLEVDLKGASIQASIALQAALIALYGVGGFYAYYYNGRCDEAGPELSGAIGSGLPDVSIPSQPIAGLYLLCSEGEAVDALKGLAGL